MPDHIYTDLEFSEDFELRDEHLSELEENLKRSSVDTRAPLKEFVPEADSFQEKVIGSESETIRMLASAGSGKTQTVLNRVLRLIQDGARADRLLILTFDNAAANSLRTKLAQQLSKHRAAVEGIRIQTLNAFGYNFLRKDAPHEFKGVIDQKRPIRLVREVREALDEKSPAHRDVMPQNIDHRFYVEFFALLKNELFDPRAPHSQNLTDFMIKGQHANVFFQSGKHRDTVQKVIQGVGWLFMAYERAMQRDGVIDFDDQKLRTYIVLRDSSSLRERLQTSFTEIIVDEFQDINRLDFVLIKLLAEKCRLVVTGDDDQAIYGFRGCNPDFIINVEKHLERSTSSYELRMNYRNPPNLVEHSNRLIRNNKHRVPKSPIAARSGACEIKVVPTFSAGLEAKFILSFIQKIRRAASTVQYSDVAILYRTNAQSLLFQVEFILSNVPYFVRQQDNILENAVLKRLLGFLRLKLNEKNNLPSDPSDALLTVESYFRFVYPETRQRLLALFRRSREFLPTLASHEFLEIMPKAASSRIVPSVKEALDATTLMSTIDVLAKRFNGLRGMVGSLEDVLQERVPLGEIFELAANFHGDIKEFVNTMEAALAQARATGAGRAKDNGVAMLTYFKSKGLQWHTVILATCNEGLIPHKRAAIEDERRLFYVAMTRAESNLLISYVKRSCNNQVDPSRFIAEAGL